ncbi:hypothetical protein [Streptomyces sp. NRRL S-340]|uniref:hypothetical protein n=1 Tax=Streptomyces sp. NRRL S-340 TaxID=1463901 RepID=UPI00055D698E|nr:hypothetical protein [Streptomyces sp. NRRL S-340]
MELRSVEELMDLLYAGRGTAGPSTAGPVTAGPGAVGRGTAAPDRPRRRADPHEHALRTAALLRRRRPADKELQVAGLVLGIGALLGPGGDAGPQAAGVRAARAADAVRGLLGERVFRLVRQQAGGHAARPLDEDALTLRLADEEARTRGACDTAGAGVLEDWRTVLELVAARNARLGAVD